MSSATSGPPRRGSALLRKLTLAAGGTLAGIALLELGLAAIGLWVGGDAAVPDPIDASTGERVFTILCVGDSWTEGKADGRYPDLLVDRLNSRGAPVRFRQVNKGRSGTNSSQALRRLPREVRESRPDLLLVLTGNNDHHNLTDSTYWKFRDESLGPGSTLAARARITLHSLRTWRLLRTARQAALGGPTPNEFFAVEPGQPPPDRGALIAIDLPTHRRQLEYNLTRIVELARAERVPVVFQTYFHFHGYHVNEIVRETAWDLGVPLVDHNLAFHTRVAAADRESYRIEDGHPNPAGYAMMADRIVEVLDENGLVPTQTHETRRITSARPIPEPR
jgi:lysophospholipase L1-like esterase